MPSHFSPKSLGIAPISCGLNLLSLDASGFYFFRNAVSKLLKILTE